MWMSEPTPVTTSTITAESGSSRNESSAWKSPAEIHVYRSSVKKRCSGSNAVARVNTCATAIANDAIGAPQASRITAGRGSTFGAKISHAPESTAAMSGRNGIQRSSSLVCSVNLSPLHLAGVFDVHGVAVAYQTDDDRQSDGDLDGGHHHDHERQDLALVVADLAAERDQRQVRGVQHQLDAHEHDDHVAAREHADHADHEDQRGDDLELERRHVAHHSSLFFASTTAAMIPARSSTPATCTAST